MTLTRHDHPALVLVGVLLAAASSGCPSPDAHGKFDRFNEQTKDDREIPELKLDLEPLETDESAGTTEVEVPVCLYLDGVFLVAIETSIAIGLPLQFIAEVDAEIDAATGDGTVTIEFQPLSLDPGSTTEPREEVGEPLLVDAEVTDCSFLVDFGETMITGAANPLTGSDIVADLSLDAVVLDEDTWCGNIDGDVISPIMASLAHSTLAASRLADRSERPVEFPVSCAQATDGG